jgi:hypothetical protein
MSLFNNLVNKHSFIKANKEKRTNPQDQQNDAETTRIIDSFLLARRKDGKTGVGGVGMEGEAREKKSTNRRHNIRHFISGSSY